jgi:hypothetical protein
VVQTPVPKTGWRASVRVRLLHLPQLTTVDWKMISRWRERRLLSGWISLGLRFDSAVFLHRSKKPIDYFAALPIITLLDFARSIATSPHASSGTTCPTPASEAGPARPSCPSHSSVQSFLFSRAPPSKPYTQILGSNPGRSTPWGERRWNGTSLRRKHPSWLRHSGARHFSRVSSRAEPTRPEEIAAHSDTHRFSRPAGQAQHARCRGHGFDPRRGLLRPRSSVAEHST